MNRLKSFFAPVKGGHQDGFTFKEFILSIKRMAPLLATSGMLTILLCTDKNTFDPIWMYYGAIGFFVSIIILFIFKTLQHWNDLKNHTSR